MSGKITKILFASDFSDNSKPAEETAVGLANLHGSSLVVVHSLELSSFAYGLPEAGASGLVEELRDSAKGQLDALEDRLRERVANIEAHLLTGPAAPSILELADALDVSVIVVGTRGLSGVKKILLGSTAQRLIQHAHQLVLTVPSDAKPVEPTKLDLILVATDFSEDAERATDAAIDLFPTGVRKHVVLINAYATPLLQTSYGSVPTSTHYLDDFRGMAVRGLERIAGRLRDLGVEVETLAAEGFPSDILVEEAERREADLIAMGTRGRTGIPHLLMGSTAERVAAHAPCPVLTVSAKVED